MVIAKEELCGVNFENNRLIENVLHKTELVKKLFQAMILGNAYKSKVRITFNTDLGHRIVETTVWAKTDDWVVLKGGAFIPINCISSVDFP